MVSSCVTIVFLPWMLAKTSAKSAGISRWVTSVTICFSNSYDEDQTTITMYRSNEWRVIAHWSAIFVFVTCNLFALNLVLIIKSTSWKFDYTTIPKEKPYTVNFLLMNHQFHVCVSFVNLSAGKYVSTCMSVCL